MKILTLPIYPNSISNLYAVFVEYKTRIFKDLIFFFYFFIKQQFTATMSVKLQKAP